MPRTNDLISFLAGSMMFTSLDLRLGYWKFRMSDESVEKTAFVTQKGHWQWLVMPIGLTNAPRTFQKVIKNVLGDLTIKFVKVYLDGIIIHRPDVCSHKCYRNYVNATCS